jgi:hypothetical protein
MQRILWTFILLSPFIALAQSYHWPVSWAFGQGYPGHHMIALVTAKAAGVVHRVQLLVG